ncbi:MAG: TspO/MBR family protein [Thermodesulfobacteriota bacterium]
MKINKLIKLIISILLCQLAGVIGSFFTTPAIPTWYQTLIKPFFTPPNWIFAPVWISLYFLMGLSLFLVWTKKEEDSRAGKAIIIFFVQLILNALWSISFFGFRSPFLGFLNIVLLWLAILWTMQKFLKISNAGGLLLLPYFLWVSYAAVLNFSLWILN